MTIYERNLEILSTYYPKMDELIEQARKNLKEEKAKVQLQEETSLDGKRILKVKTGDRECYLNGRRNATDPAEKWMGSLGELQEHAPVIMMGVGNATYFQELMEHVKKHLVVIIYEPSLEIFVDFLEHIELEAWLEKHTIVFWVDGIEGMTLDAMKGMLKKVLNYEILPFSRTLILPNYNVLFPEETLAFVKVCHSIADEGIIRFNTAKRFEGVFVKNLFANMIFLCDGYKTTQLPRVIPHDTPGIVVAAGPSLNKNIHELKKAKGKAFIIAADTAVKPLLRAGIVPDMFAIVDAKKPLSLFEVEGAREIPLVTTIDASSDVLRYHTGMKFFANEGVRYVDRLFARCDRQIGTAAEGGSVATAAFTLLHKLGINTIILVGQDLALTDNRTHADGTFEEQMPEVETSNCIMVEGNIEKQVPTRPDFQIYLRWYNMYIEEVKKRKPEFRVINATEGGARIKNTEIMTLKEAIEQECTKEVNVSERLQQLHPLFEGEDRKWVVEQIKNIPYECEQLGLEAKKTAKLYNKLDTICSKRTIDQKAYLNLLKKLDKQVKKIEADEMYQFVSLTLNEAQYIIKNEQLLSYDSIQEEGKEIARKGVLYMNSVAQCAEIFREYADSVLADWQE